MQTASDPIELALEVPQSMEVQNRPVVHVERIDPMILQLVSLLFPCQGLKLLALLCRRATEKQSAMFTESVAVISFHGISLLCQSPDWEWGYHATLRYFIILEALGIFVRFRSNRTTVIHIPLGQREKPPKRESLLKALADLRGKYKDKKLTELIASVQKQIEIYDLDMLGDSQGQISLHTLTEIQERVVSVMRAEHIPLAKSKRIAQWIIQTQFPQFIRDSQELASVQTGRYQCKLGDSSESDHSEARGVGVDSQDVMGDSQNLQLSLQQKKTDQNRPYKAAHSDQSTLINTQESSVSDLELLSTSKRGDSDPVPSISNLSLDRITKEKRIDIEEPQTVMPQSDASLSKFWGEARDIAIELDGEDSLKENDGKGWIPAYLKRLEQNPYLVRASLIDMFMQRTFPNYKGVPDGRGGRWFYTAYNRYVAHPDRVPSDIASWARSDYSYEQIKEALLKERNRQEEEIRRNPYSAESLTRPDADCVEKYGLLRDDQETMPSPDEETSADVVETLIQQGDLIEMEDGSLLTAPEYEQLQIRAIEEEKRRVLLLLSNPSEEALAMLGTYVEHCLVAQLDNLPSVVLEDLEKLRGILHPELYTAEVRMVGSSACAIRVQAHGNANNSILLSTTEQVELFIQYITNIPDDVFSEVQQLGEVLDPELYRVDRKSTRLNSSHRL